MKKNKVQGARGIDITQNRHLEFRVRVTVKSFSYFFKTSQSISEIEAHYQNLQLN